MSEPCPLPAAAVGARPATARLVRDVPHELLEGSHRVWQKVLAFLTLDREERRAYFAMRGNERRRNEWLFGRVAAKDAVRLHLQERHGIAVGAADIAIQPDDHGRPLVRGAWLHHWPGIQLHLSIAHTEGLAVAVVCEGGDVAGIGVDAEPIRDPSPTFLEGAFSGADRAALAGADAQAPWRRWCAKEAVGKALGVGLAYDPRDLRIAGEDAADGRVDLRLDGAWREAFPEHKEKIISAYTFAREHGIFAVCVL